MNEGCFDGWSRLNKAVYQSRAAESSARLAEPWASLSLRVFQRTAFGPSSLVSNNETWRDVVGGCTGGTWLNPTMALSVFVAATPWQLVLLLGLDQRTMGNLYQYTMCNRMLYTNASPVMGCSPSG